MAKCKNKNKTIVINAMYMYMYTCQKGRPIYPRQNEGNFYINFLRLCSHSRKKGEKNSASDFGEDIFGVFLSRAFF